MPGAKADIGVTKRERANQVKRVRVAIVAALFVAGWVSGALHAAPAARASTCGNVSCFGPGDAAWDAYYANPTDSSKWAAFCGGGGGSVAVQAIGVPACGPTGSTNIALKSGNIAIYTPGFQCVELTDRYLFVKKGWTAEGANGAGVARTYAAAHGMSTVSNGTVGTAPRVGDVISFSNQSNFSDTGHAAVVSASTVDGNGNGSVTILNQNVSINGAQATGATLNLTVSNWNVGKLGFNYLEWLPVGSGAARVPDAPAAPTATAGDGSARVSFVPPSSDGGSPITGYTVTASPGGATASGASSPLTVPGLSNGTAYTLTVHATNALGNSAESPASNAVTPRALPSVSVRDASVTETNTATTATFNVVLSAASTSAVSVQYATADNTAKAASDYTAKSGTVTFAPGELSKPVTVTVAGDALYEVMESFRVNLSNPSGATIADGQGLGKIQNDDPRPSVSIADVSKLEGAAGATTKLTFTVRLSAVSGAQTKVHWATADGTAVAGTDYTAANATVLIPAGATTKTFTVTVKGDATFEQDETFVVNLTSPVNATIADNQAVGTIDNDD
ncbi:MAG TPA: Calx-beta domain-containing protein [Acidimicrobiales bacterium]|nr:Calx-beta domain-containing protein [Acidimicrobiales bacterium]